MLCRWITGCTCSTGRAYRRMASMTSNPLFIRVALSMVIFAPMCQLGWRRASAAVTCSSWSWVLP